MPTPHHDTQLEPALDSLWLELRLDEERWLFELASDDDQAITVGSHPSARVHIPRPGVAATHFHFERDRNAIFAVPGYRAALRINSVKAPAPLAVPEHATLDFCGTSIESVIHRTRPSDFADKVGARPTPAEYLRALPSENDATAVARSVATAPVSVSTFDTVEVSPPRFKTEGLVPLGAVPLPPEVAAPLGPQGTVVMRVVRPESIPPLPPAAEPTRPTVDFSRTERIPVFKDTADVAGVSSPDSTPTRVDAPAARRSSAPPAPVQPQAVVLQTPPTPPTPLAVSIPIPTPAVLAPMTPTRSLLPEPASAMKTADFDVAAMAPFFATPAAGVPSHPAPPTPSPNERPLSQPRATPPSVPSTGASPMRSTRAPAWLIAVGQAAKHRPVPVAAAALAASIVLSLALVGGARLTGGHRGEVRPSSPRTIASSASVVGAAPIATQATVSTTPPAVSPSVAAPQTVDAARILAAATHLSSGRYVEAKAAYGLLATEQPANHAYVGIARVLGRWGSPRCQQKPPANGCPEVIP